MPFNILTPASTAEASASFQVDVLKRFFKLAKPVIPAKTTIPVLEHIRIYTEKGKGFLLATNLECFVRVEINGLGKGTIDLSVSFKALDAMLTKIGNGSILLERNGDMLSFKLGKTHFEMKGYDGKDFPILKPFTAVVDTATWATKDIVFVNQYVASVASKDTSRIDLNGVLVSIDGDKCDFMSSDRHILVCTDYAHEKQYNVPKILFEVLSAIEFVQPLTASFSENGVKVTCGSATITCAYIKIPFPNMVNNLIPKTFKYQYKLNVVKLRDHLTKMVNLATTPKEASVPVGVNLKKNTFFVDMMDVNCTSAETPDDEIWMRIDARRWLLILERFNDVTEIFAGFNAQEGPTLWWDSHAKSLLMPLLFKR